MRQQIVLTALLTATTVIAAAQMSTRDIVTTAEEEIRRLENEQLDARLRRDFAALDRIWADEFVFTLAGFVQIEGTSLSRLPG